MIKLLFFIFFVLSAVGCMRERSVTITKDFVTNPFWDKVDNYFEIYKMKVKDSIKNIEPENPTEAELYYGLVKDTNFSFVANVKYNGEDYSKRKVYFNKNNGFVWRKPSNLDPQRNLKYETIGELQQNTWYLLAGLSQLRVLYYVYIDNADSLHVYRVSTMTNY